LPPAAADDRNPKTPNGAGLGHLSHEQLDVLRTLGIVSEQQARDLAGPAGAVDDRPRDARGFRVTDAGDKAAFLSNFPAANRYGSGEDSPGVVSRLLDRVQRQSERAVQDLEGDVGRTRTVDTALGPFSGYETRAEVVGKGKSNEELHVFDSTDNDKRRLMRDSRGEQVQWSRDLVAQRIKELRGQMRGRPGDDKSPMMEEIKAARNLDARAKARTKKYPELVAAWARLSPNPSVDRDFARE
jgi:hypothetical protein